MKTYAAWLCRSLAVALALGSPPAGAEPGVLEINHACATGTGCFPGDAVGYPVTIDGTTARSFRLTSDLVIQDANKTAISIQASHVTVDLGGFRIQGPNACSGTPTTCALEGVPGIGVAVDAIGPREGVVVRNGSIAGMGDHGVLLGNSAIVRDLRLSDNGGSGIVVSAGCLVASNVIERNGSVGIQLAAIGSTAVGNSVSRNGAQGIFAASGSRIAENVVIGNGQAGISISNGSSAVGNTIRGNANIGLTTVATSSYSGNTITANVVDQVVGGGQNLGGNYCNGTGTTSASCP